jgi:hypothetical protein
MNGLATLPTQRPDQLGLRVHDFLLLTYQTKALQHVVDKHTLAYVFLLMYSAAGLGRGLPLLATTSLTA